VAPDMQFTEQQRRSAAFCGFPRVPENRANANYFRPLASRGSAYSFLYLDSNNNYHSLPSIGSKKVFFA